MERYYKKYSKFLVFPAVFLFICVVAIPFAIGLLYSFTSWRGTYFANGTLMESFVGLDNYMKVFTNAQFGKSFLYTCCYTVLSVITINICALLLALMVTSITKGAGLFRTVLFMPNMLGGLALGFIWQFIFQVVFTDIFGPLFKNFLDFFKAETSDLDTACCVTPSASAISLSVFPSMQYCRSL